MRVLAIDTALGACAAAVLDSQAGAILASESVGMLRGHAEAVMPMIARVMDAARCEFAELDRIAVTVGPGSFTGLRVGISAARGIALAAGKPAIGLSTLSALAAPHVAARANQTIIAAIDARNEQVYFHVFAPNGVTTVSPRLDRVRAAVRAAPARRASPGSRPAAAPMTGWLAGLFASAEPVLSAAGPRDAVALAALHAASFNRGWSEHELEQLLTDRSVVADRAIRGRRILG